MNLVVVRHGETVENASDIIMGQRGGTLSARGVEQAKQTAEKLKDETFDQAWASDLKRCVDTAKIILEHHPDLELRQTAALREVNYGEFQGKPASEIRGWFALHGGYSRDLKVPGGESNREMSRRVLDFINRLLVRSPERSILLVTHTGPIEAIRSSVERTPFSADAENGSVRSFEIRQPLQPYLS